MRAWVLLMMMVPVSWTTAWGVVIESGIGEFSDVFDNSVLVESQGLYGFSGWLVDPVFAGSMGGPVYRFGRVLEFRMGPFGTVRPTLLPVNPIAVDSFAVERDYRGSSTSAWILDRGSKSQSPGTIRYRFSIGGDTGDPLIHRYTQPEWNRVNRDKIGPTHALYLGRRIPLSTGGVMDVSLAGGERRYSTLTPENQESRGMLSPTHANDWNQQRWVSGAITLPQVHIEAGYCDFGGWEYFPILGFELPVEGWTAGAGAEVEIPLTKKLQSRGTISWSGFGVEYPPEQGNSGGNHSNNEFRLRHRLQYRTSGRLTWMFDQELEGRIGKYLTVLGPNWTPATRYSKVSSYRGIYNLSAHYTSEKLTLTEIPQLSISQNVRYIVVLDEFDGGIEFKRRSRSGNSLFGIHLGTHLRLIDPLETTHFMFSMQSNGTDFFLWGVYRTYRERVFVSNCYYEGSLKSWKWLAGIELTTNPQRIKRVNFYYDHVENTPVTYVWYYLGGRQDDVTVTGQVRKEPTRILGGRAEYRYHWSWQGVHAGIPEHRAIVELQARIRTGLTVSLQWQGYSDSDWSDMVAGDDTELPAWGVWSMSVSQKAFRGKLEGTIRVWNLSDQLIRTHPLGPMRPRRLELAIQVMI